jgi:hypothetical protein
MKLENKHEKVTPFPHFLYRLLRYALFAGSLIIFSLLLGTVGYYYFARLGWLDSFHMTCMILTGMGPVSEMSTPEAKLFSSIYALYSGIAFLSIAGVFFAPIVHRILHILHVDADN